MKRTHCTTLTIYFQPKNVSTISIKIDSSHRKENPVSFKITEIMQEILFH